MDSMEVPGERATEHPQGVRRRRKRQSRQRRTQHPQGVRRRRKRQSRQRRTQGGGPYKVFYR